MGPKSENVEQPLVFVCFFDGQSGHGSEGSASVGLARRGKEVEKCDF